VDVAAWFDLSNSDPSPRLAPVLAFTGLYIALASAGALLRGGRELPMYLGVMAVMVPALYLVHRRYPLTAPLLWSFSAWGLLHMAGGLMTIPESWSREGNYSLLYSWWLIPGWLRYDHVVHAFGFGITTWLCWHILKSALRAPNGLPVHPSPGILLLCVAAGMGFGAFNEMVEFIATHLLPENNIGDYQNTGWDLVANFAGALVAVALIRCAENPEKR
jgi:uncharacterized membrane protein YjdF